MKKFQFHLQKLLEYRSTIEERLLAELSGIRAEYERELTRLKGLHAQMESSRKNAKETLSSGNCDEIRSACDYLNSMGERIKVQEHILCKIEERRRLKMVEVMEAAKDRKALEQLKDQKKIEHKKETERQEQVFLDDIASTRKNRANSAEATN